MLARDVAEQASVPTAWEQPAALPQLADGELHVWLCELSDVGGRLLEALSDEERARAARFPQREKSELWARSRAVLRALLGAYTGTPPAFLHLQASPAGKLTLERGPAFSLAHSGRLALYALSDAGDVGVDVEVEPAGGRRVTPGLASRAFAPERSAAVLGLPEEQRERELLRLWVRHEARLKLLGTGLAGTEQVKTHPEPWLFDLSLGPEAAGAVALASAPRGLRLWQWPPRAAGHH